MAHMIKPVGGTPESAVNGNEHRMSRGRFRQPQLTKVIRIFSVCETRVGGKRR